mmetsp:Transcript_12108/g.34682  ORF Transcript_12108/g.34682 Transcript_12108/m.34682 type:complete len:308 (+) Transcript_12108:676-1599(+)
MLCRRLGRAGTGLRSSCALWTFVPGSHSAHGDSLPLRLCGNHHRRSPLGGVFSQDHTGESIVAGGRWQAARLPARNDSISTRLDGSQAIAAVRTLRIRNHDSTGETIVSGRGTGVHIPRIVVVGRKSNRGRFVRCRRAFSPRIDHDFQSPHCQVLPLRSVPQNPDGRILRPHQDEEPAVRSHRKSPTQDPNQDTRGCRQCRLWDYFGNAGPTGKSGPPDQDPDAAAPTETPKFCHSGLGDHSLQAGPLSEQGRCLGSDCLPASERRLGPRPERGFERPGPESLRTLCVPGPGPLEGRERPVLSDGLL